MLSKNLLFLQSVVSWHLGQLPDAASPCTEPLIHVEITMKCVTQWAECQASRTQHMSCLSSSPRKPWDERPSMKKACYAVLATKSWLKQHDV